jgi:hypothetical protein
VPWGDVGVVCITGRKIKFSSYMGQFW